MENKTKLEAALDELLSGKTTEEIVGPNGLLKQLTKALVERAMNAELSHHLGYEKHAAEGRGSSTTATARAGKRFRVISALWKSRCHGIATAPTIQRLSLNMNGVSRVSIRRFCPCMRVG